MVELDLSFVSFLALAFAVGSVLGFLLRGLRRKRIEDMLEFFRQRDKEQDRKISLLERELSDARGRLLSLKADQGKGDKSAGDLRASYEDAQRTIAKLREELLRPIEPPAPVAAEVEPAVEPDTAPADPVAAAPAPEDESPVATPVATPAPAQRSSSPAKGNGRKNASQKKGRLP